MTCAITYFAEIIQVKQTAEAAPQSELSRTQNSELQMLLKRAKLLLTNHF